MPSGITETSNRTTFRAGSAAPSDAISRIRGETPALTYTATAPSSAVTWSDNGAGGSFQVSGINNIIAVYTPKNKTQAVVITASDSGGGVNRSLQVYGTMPLQPQVGAEMELDVDTKIKKARDGTRYSREDGGVWIKWAFAWDNRQDDEYAEMMQFWRDHRKIYPFYMLDTEGNILNRVWFTTSFKRAFNGAQRWAMSAAFEGLDEATPAP